MLNGFLNVEEKCEIEKLELTLDSNNETRLCSSDTLEMPA